jgi:hypothetical protein
MIKELDFDKTLKYLNFKISQDGFIKKAEKLISKT